MENEERPEQSTGRTVKVARLIADYRLEGFGEELEQRWTADGDARRSLRELADEFNQRLLTVELERAGERPVEGEVENLYRLLADAEVSTNARTQAENRLARAGVDPDAIRRDFVSHQAVHTYLTQVREVTPPSAREQSGDPVENRREIIQRLRSRLVAVTDRGLESLRSTDRIAIGAFDVTVGVTVHCRDCNRSFPVPELLDRGRCDCA